MIGSLNHVTLSVTELERSFEFYSGVLGFRPTAFGAVEYERLLSALRDWMGGD